MDKQKEIEEMAKDLNSSFVIMTTESFSDCLDIAKFLVDLGYLKINKDSVVLTREEYSDYLILQKNHEFIREKAKELQADNERLYKNIGKFKEIASKEKAEKLLNDIFKICKQRFNDTKGYTCWGDIEIAIQQYAEQVGVEIKEH